MKTIKIIAVTALIYSAMTSAKAQTDFSGEYNRNADQSLAGGLSPNSVPITVKIRQDNGTINIQSVVKDGKGELHRSNDTLKLDGTIKTILYSNNGRKRLSSVVWSGDKTKFTYKIAIIDANGITIQDWKEQYILLDGGNRLEIDVDVKLGEDRNYTLKEIFDKA